MYKALYRKYRPRQLEDICGQKVVVNILKNEIINNKVSHAYIFSGPRGTGKTSIARIFAKIINCENKNEINPCDKCVNCTQTNSQDIIEMDAASNNSVDEIRELCSKVELMPTTGKYKIYIIDEVHMLTTGAFNALLKTLEEPPSHAIFILATTELHKIPTTILSRCQRLDFNKITNTEIEKRLKKISQIEKIIIEDEALKEIANNSDGGMRDSIGLLEKVFLYKNGNITLDDVHTVNGSLNNNEIEDLIKYICDKNIKALYKKIEEFNDAGKLFTRISEQMIIYLKKLLLEKITNNISKKTQSKIVISKEQIINYIEELNSVLFKMNKSSNSQLLFEICIIKLIGFNNKNEELKEQKDEKKFQNENKNILVLKEKEKKELIKSDKKNINKNEKPKEQLDELKNEKANFKINKEIKEKIKTIKDRRIENTLANFSKKQTIQIKKELDSLNGLILKPEYAKIISIIMDGALKAASDENLIFVYKKEIDSDIFNENILLIEELLERELFNKYNVISTFLDDWNIIKNKFNNKEKKFEYIKEKTKIEELFNVKEKKIDMFSEIIEYD